MSKRHDEIDVVPFVPSLSPVCRIGDTFLLFSVVVAGLLAAVACAIGALA